MVMDCQQEIFLIANELVIIYGEFLVFLHNLVLKLL